MAFVPTHRGKVRLWDATYSRTQSPYTSLYTKLVSLDGVPMKFLFSILVGSVLVVLTAGLVGIYWSIGLLARTSSLITMPFHRLFSSR